MVHLLLPGNLERPNQPRARWRASWTCRITTKRLNWDVTLEYQVQKPSTTLKNSACNFSLPHSGQTATVHIAVLCHKLSQSILTDIYCHCQTRDNCSIRDVTFHHYILDSSSTSDVTFHYQTLHGKAFYRGHLETTVCASPNECLVLKHWQG